MKRLRVFSVVFCAALTVGFFNSARADEPQPHPGGPSEKIGEVHFLTSCGAEAQKRFDRAVALLHSFWYEESEKAFRAAAEAEPACAMAYWGIAMSNFHPLWAPPTPAELARGREALEEAKRHPPKSERERDYLAAIESFYRDAETLDHRTRALAYEKAMERLAGKHPNDREAAIFYALALDGTALPTDKSYANQKKAGEILTKIFEKAPDHPGVAHYIIHSYDYPPLARLALPAARRYAKIAPSSPHAQHMPSHIFTRLGLWKEAIESNLASAAAAKAHVEKKQPGAASFEQLHAMDYLMYAHLQLGQDGEAKRTLDEIRRMDQVDNPSFVSAYAFAAVPARWALERRNWAEASALTPQPASFPWGRHRASEAIIHFARALGLAR
ncbi:MAG TPA: hypothetical protein VI382_02755, partial [Candidatus Manganitrophaceae bacterium]|nr:hypothetical protein [Candidatus Manganitrophaceae bacterium]